MPKKINFETGVILPAREIELGANSSISSYIEDLAAILELPIGSRELLFEFSQIIDAEGTIILNRSRKNQILEKLSITIGTIDNYLSLLVKAGVLKRRYRSTYQANSYLFSGMFNFLAVTDIPEERLAFKLQVAYNFSGKRKISLVFPEE